MSLFAAALVTGATAQHANLDIQPIRKNIEIGNKAKPGNVGQQKGATVWSNDFSTASDWVRTNSSTPAQNWWITTDPNSIPVSALAPAGFTSASNGYGFINSDSAGNSATQDAYLTLATPFNLLLSGSTASNFSLTFENSYRTYLDTREVMVSGDGGSTWTTYTITDGSDAGTNTANPQVTSLNITSVVAPGGILSSNVLVQFHYVGNWGWYWAVDDVAIVETDDNDLRVEEASFGSTGSWGMRMPYYMVPTDQIMPVTYWTSVTNIGAVDQTNTAVAVDVNSGTFTGSSAAGFTSVVGSLDTLNLTVDYTPAASVGTHSASYTVASDFTDADPSNNTGASTFDVTQFIYARDNGTPVGGSYNSGNAYEIGNIFDIVTSTTLYGANITIGSSSEGNPLIYAKLYSIDPGTGDFIFMEQSDDYALDASEFGTEIYLPLLSAQTLNAGEPYLLVVGAYGDGGATSDLVTATAGDSEAQTTFYFDGTDQTWYYTTSTPMVRMNFDMDTWIAAGVEENTADFTVGQNYPNPFNGNTRVNYSLVNADNVMIEITDLTGKVIAVMNEGSKAAGNHTVELNSNELSAGTYFYSVVTSTGRITKAMTVAK